MLVTGDQLQQLIVIVRRDFGPLRQLQRSVPSEEDFIADILRQEYGVTGVVRPTYEVVHRDYVPIEWQARRSGPTLSFGGRGSSTPPFQRQVLADLDTLRSSPLAALVYIIARAAGHDNANAMHFAHLAQSISRLVMISRPLQYSRTISSTTGRVRSSPTPTVPRVMPQSRGSAWVQQQLYQRNLQQLGQATRPAGSGGFAPAPTPPLRR